MNNGNKGGRSSWIDDTVIEKTAAKSPPRSYKLSKFNSDSRVNLASI